MHKEVKKKENAGGTWIFDFMRKQRLLQPITDQELITTSNCCTNGGGVFLRPKNATQQLHQTVRLFCTLFQFFLAMPVY